MKFSTFANIVFTAVAVVISMSLCTPAYAKNTDPEAVTEAYFFALEHGNYDGAFSLYSDKFKSRYSGAKGWEAAVKENMPQLAIHEARAIESSLTGKDTARVEVMIVGQDMEVWAFILTLKIENGLWKIVGGVAMRVGTAKPAM